MATQSAFSNFVLVVFRTLGKLPLPLRQRIGRCLGALFATMPLRERRIAELQLELIFGKEKARTYLSKVYQNLGQTACEVLNLEPLLDNFAQHFEGPDSEKLLELVRSKKPALILSAHTANWDLLGAYAGKLGLPIALVGKPMRSLFWQDVLTEIRTSYGAQMLWRSGGSGDVRRIVRAVRSGTSLAALIDQDTQVNSVSVPFFGRPAKTPDTLVDLAKDLSLPIYSTFIFRKSPDRFIVFFEKLDDQRSSYEILCQFNLRLEQYLRQYPWQWVWVHKRWRTQSDGITLSSADYIDFLKREAHAS